MSNVEKANENLLKFKYKVCCEVHKKYELKNAYFCLADGGK